MLASDGKVMICDSGEPITSQSDNSQHEFSANVYQNCVSTTGL